MKTIAVFLILSGACDGTDVPAECWGAWNGTEPIFAEQPDNINHPIKEGEK